MNTTDLTQLNINVLTQEQYEQAKEDETLDADGLYMVDDDIHQMGVELDFEGVEKRTLLWTNPNPAADFVPQTINIQSVVNYDYLIIETGANTTQTILHRVASNGATVLFGVGETVDCFSKRQVTVNANSAVFGQGQSLQTYAGTTFVDSPWQIKPQRIYGIKKLQPSYNVIPQQVDYVVDNRDGERVWKSGHIDYLNDTYVDITNQCTILSSYFTPMIDIRVFWNEHTKHLTGWATNKTLPNVCDFLTLPPSFPVFNRSRNAGLSSVTPDTGEIVTIEGTRNIRQYFGVNSPHATRIIINLYIDEFDD